MKSIGIITINDNNNYGNRLQNYAVQEIFKKKNCKVDTLKNIEIYNNKKGFFLRLIKYSIKNKKISIQSKRSELFAKFNNNVRFSKRNWNAYSYMHNQYDYIIVGSDQVWNPMFGRLSDVDLACFASKNKKISFSASFGISELPKKYK